MSATIASQIQAVRDRWDPEFQLVENEFIPWAMWHTPIAKAKVALISTGGLYFKNGLHKPFDIERPGGDGSFREFPAVALGEDLAIAHGRYDESAAREDVSVLFPLERLHELAAGGYIGEVGAFAYSFGHVTRPLHLLSNYAPNVAYRLKRMGADVVLLVAAGSLVDHQTAALVARAVELAGVPTLLLGTNRAALEAGRAPRSVVVSQPEGSPVGSPGNAGKQQHVIRTALETAWEFEAPGTIAEI